MIDGSIPRDSNGRPVIAGISSEDPSVIVPIAVNPLTGAMLLDPAGISASAAWGTITGTLSDQTDLQAALDAKQDVLTGLTASVTELNILDGATLSTTELNYVDGVTSAIQTQLDGKQPLDSDLTTLAGLTATTDNFIVSVSSAWASRTPAQVKTTLDLNNVDNTSDATKNSAVTTLTNKTLGDHLTLAENAAFLYDPVLSADGRYNGLVRAGTAGTTLAFGDLVYLDPTDSRWELADANSTAGADGDARGILGVCVLAAASDGSATVILLNGIVRADTAFPTMTVNNQMYVSETAGDITGTQPTTTDAVIRVVGIGLTGDELYFNPSYDYITHT